MRRGVADGRDREVRRDPLPKAALHHIGNVAIEGGDNGIPNEGTRLVVRSDRAGARASGRKDGEAISN